MTARVVEALRELLGSLTPDGVGVAVLHGWCAKAAIVDLVGLPPGSHTAVRGMDNCHAAVLVETPTGLRLSGYNLRLEAAQFASTTGVG